MTYTVLLLLATASLLLLGCVRSCEDGGLRLVDGFNNRSGRVEFCHGGEWGTVCDDRWRSENSQVVCRQLGLPTDGAKLSVSGRGNGTIFLDNVNCSGWEERLENCRHHGIGVHNCDHSEDVGVICGEIEPNVGERCGYEDSQSELTREELERTGNCVPFKIRERGTPCDVLFTPGVDYVYIPYQRGGNLDDYLYYIELVGLLIADIPDECLEHSRKVLCHYYLPPCGNSSVFKPPTSVCTEECNYVAETCSTEWAQLRTFIETHGDTGQRFGLTPINCSNTGEYLHFESYSVCCSDVGIDIPCTKLNDSGKLVPDPACLSSAIDTIPYGTVRYNIYGSTNSVQPSSMASPGSSQQVSRGLAITVGIMCVAVTALLLVVTGVVVWILIKKHRGKRKQLSNATSSVSDSVEPLPDRDAYLHDIGKGNFLQPVSTVPSKGASVSSEYISQMAHLLIPSSSIHLLDSIGQGKFGVVYRATLSRWKDYEQEIVAVKTLKGVFSMNEINSLVEESLKMSKFNHPNVMRLVGVCIDSGESPYIVMPFMTHGSLLSYLRKHRAELTIANSDNMELVIAARKKLLSMCLQVTKGMSYLANERIVHRDLATRNCMIDINFVIKVADFGLSKDVYARNYFRQRTLGEEEGEEAKLPVRWMALESLNDGVFTEKTDVWSFGVTCWEVFALGKSPYPGVDPFTLLKYLERGERLEKPVNAACSQEIYDIMKECWRELPDNRPTFSDLVTTISTSLEAIAGYLDLTAVPLTPAGTLDSEYDHLNVIVTDGSGEDQEQDHNLD